MTLKGVNGTVTFDGRFVTISRQGALARMTVTAVQFKPASALARGYIQFTIPGGNEMRSRPGSQTRSAAGDENSVLFAASQQQDFERLRSVIEDSLA